MNKKLKIILTIGAMVYVLTGATVLILCTIYGPFSRQVEIAGGLFLAELLTALLVGIVALIWI